MEAPEFPEEMPRHRKLSTYNAVMRAKLSRRRRRESQRGWEKREGGRLRVEKLGGNESERVPGIPALLRRPEWGERPGWDEANSGSQRYTRNVG